VGEPGDPWGQRRFERHNRGLEFDRVAVFADAVYAIAMTLIVVGIDVPDLIPRDDDGALLDALGDELSKITMFFITFLVIGNYWLAHHRFVASLRAVDSRFVLLHLGYLAFIAFLPFPAAVLGEFAESAVAVSFFALTMAGASVLETCMLVRAQHAGLLVRRLTPDGLRWEVTASLVPVASFLLSIPVAFVAPWLGMLTWLLALPAQIFLGRHRPAQLSVEAEEG
jgi:uncharacterized membrane protein